MNSDSLYQPIKALKFNALQFLGAIGAILGAFFQSLRQLPNARVPSIPSRIKKDSRRTQLGPQVEQLAIGPGVHLLILPLIQLLKEPKDGSLVA